MQEKILSHKHIRSTEQQQQHAIVECNKIFRMCIHTWQPGGARMYSEEERAGHALTVTTLNVCLVSRFSRSLLLSVCRRLFSFFQCVHIWHALWRNFNIKNVVSYAVNLRAIHALLHLFCTCAVARAAGVCAYAHTHFVVVRTRIVQGGSKCNCPNHALSFVYEGLGICK